MMFIAFAGTCHASDVCFRMYSHSFKVAHREFEHVPSGCATQSMRLGAAGRRRTREWQRKGRGMARKHSKRDPYGDRHREEDAEAAAPAVPCWLCSRPTGETIVWHHPVPKSRGGRDTVPMHPICQQTLITNFTNSELQRHGMDVDGLLANPVIRKFVDWVANKDPDFSATIARKQR